MEASSNTATAVPILVCWKNSEILRSGGGFARLAAMPRSRAILIGPKRRPGRAARRRAASKFCLPIPRPSRDKTVPPVIGSYVGQVDGHIVVSGWQASDDEDHDFNSTRLFVFGPGSRHWTEWDIPAGFRFIGPRYAAVRIG